jgi:thiosulfate/3-mercaptopyruvate sulfurtransferase
VPFSNHKQTTFAAILPLLALLLMLAACNENDNGNSGAASTTEFPADDYPGGEILISVDGLHDRLDDPDLRLVDLSAISTYEQGHIPGAVHIWWQDTIEINNNVYGMMAGENTRAELFRDAGITESSYVVVYDDRGGANAARFLWLLHAMGFDDNAALLNGGSQAWEAEGFDLTTDEPEPPDGEINQEPNYDVLVGDGNGDVRQAIDNPAIAIVDGRSDEERQETWFERLRIGQIPTSIHLPRDETVQDGEVPYVKSPDELMAMLPDDLVPGGDESIIAYGLHGVAASHTWFTLKLLGFETVRMYDASWAEWGADPERPIEEWD